MCTTCYNVHHMGMIQIRNVPDDVHRALKARAASMGLSLSEYLNHELSMLAALPRIEEVTRRIRALEPVTLAQSPAEMIRELRGPLPGDD